MSLVGAGAGLVLLFIIGCVIYCCCCRGKAKRRKQYESRERDDKRKRQDMKERQDARKSDRKTKNDAIRKKYGKLISLSNHHVHDLALHLRAVQRQQRRGAG